MSNPIFKSVKAARDIETQYKQVLERWPIPKTELYVPTRYGSTFVMVSGPEHAQPLMLFHGSQANSAAWRPDIAIWSTKFRVFAVDMIGEAGLSAPVRPALAGEEHALWLDDIFKGLGVSCAAIVGTSLGGWLALDYASKRPRAVCALALISPGGIGQQKNFLLKVLPLLLLGSWGRRKIRELVFGPEPTVLPENLQPIAELMDNIGRAIKPRVVRIPQLTNAQLQALNLPILTIVGEKDVLLDSLETKNRLQRYAPHAEIHFIKNGYHFIPGQTVRIMSFLEKICANG